VKLKIGVDEELEEQADALIAADRRTHPATNWGCSYLDYPYLAPAQLKTRIQHEVFVSTGVPEEHLYRGVFGRVHNRELGNRPRHPKTHQDDYDDWKGQ